MAALEAEEDVEFREDSRRNQQDGAAKGVDESAQWLKIYTWWPTRFVRRPLNILVITKTLSSASTFQITSIPNSQYLK
jgi:hypothetical protein